MSEHQFNIPPSTRSYWRGCRCINCKVESRKYRAAWAAQHPERVRESSQRYEKRHAAHRRIRRPRNPDKDRAQRKRTKERRVESHKAYRASERGRKTRRAAHKAYKARKRGAKGTTSIYQWNARWAYYGGLCYLCGKPAVGMDHVIPLSRGGSHWPSNLRPCCHLCNSRKGTKSLSEYLICGQQIEN